MMDQETGTAVLDPRSKACAFETYAAMRETSPLFRVQLPDGRTLWFVTRYAEAVELFKDHGQFVTNQFYALTAEEQAQLFKQVTSRLTPDQQELAAQTNEILSCNLMAVDPQDHARLRVLVAIPFTPKYVEGLRPRVQAIAEDLLDGVELRAKETGRREIELIDDFAYPLPLIVIAEMLGIPVEDQERFREWSRTAVSFTPSDATNPEITNPQITATFSQFISYLRDLIAQKRTDPANDLLSGLVAAESKGNKLSENELLALILLLIVAGHETTTNLIANGMLALLENPDQHARLRENPNLIRATVEEILRYYGPVEMTLTRWVREDIEFGGEQLRRGEEIVALLASNNRDERRFPCPDVFDVGREPNHHLAFGTGIHTCLGASLARMEGQEAINMLLTRMPNLALAIDKEEVEWRKGTFLRGLTRLPMSF